MCIATISTVTAVASAVSVLASTAVTTAMSVSQNSAQKQAVSYQMEQAKKEAKKAEMEAAYERQEGIESARKQKISAILNMGNEKARMAGSNIALTSDTVLNLENDTKINAELDALTTQRNSERKASYYTDRISNLYQNAALKNYNRKVNTISSYIGLGQNFQNASVAMSNLGGAIK